MVWKCLSSFCFPVACCWLWYNVLCPLSVTYSEVGVLLCTSGLFPRSVLLTYDISWGQEPVGTWNKIGINVLAADIADEIVMPLQPAFCVRMTQGGHQWGTWLSAGVWLCVLGGLKGTIPPPNASRGCDLMVGSTACKFDWGEKMKIIHEVSMLLCNTSSVSWNFWWWLNKYREFPSIKPVRSRW